METNVKIIDDITIVEIIGDIDGKVAPQIQEQIVAQVNPEGKLILDMGQVGYMSSAGLRMLLSTYRQASAQKATVVVAGLSEMLKETMSATGFIRFFTIYDTVELALENLK